MQSASLERTRRQSARRYRAEVERAWEQLTHTGEVGDSTVREPVRQSWRRCLALGVAPATQLPPPAATDDTLARLHETNRELMLAASNTWRLLADILASTRSILLVADAAGVIIDTSGNEAVLERGGEVGIARGYRWSELSGGTNAVGTAIALRQPIEVQTVEHFCSLARGWTCAAAPVRDAIDGEVLGVIDITNLGESSHGHALALAVTTAHQIEQTLQSRELARHVQLLQWYQSNLPRWSNHALLLLDRKGRIVTSNGHAQSLFRDRQLVEHMSRGAPLLRIGDTRVAAEQLDDLPHGLHAHALERYGRCGDWDGGLLVLDAVHTVAPRRARAGHAAQPAVHGPFEAIVARSDVMLGIMDRAARMATAAAPVLIRGETGTGKTLFARAVHAASSAAAGPFVAVDCSALNRELAAGQLLGYEPGAAAGPRGAAGKFEQADGGTLFLDDVSALPAEVQAQVLRVLRDGVVVRVGGLRERALAVRIVAASDRDLAAAVASGSLREDLYYRLNVLTLDLPPLRARREDIAPLAEHAIAEFNERYGYGPKRLRPELLRWFENHEWPGNVPQLRAVIESMYVLGRGEHLDLGDLPAGLDVPLAAAAPPARAPLKCLSLVERDAIEAHLAAHGGNRSRVARALGISRSTLYRKLAQYDIDC